MYKSEVRIYDQTRGISRDVEISLAKKRIAKAIGEQVANKLLKLDAIKWNIEEDMIDSIEGVASISIKNL
jgi:hypothetical protein